ncbi:MAG: SRPBCC domain-containing protein [Aestuariivirga sp.]
MNTEPYRDSIHIAAQPHIVFDYFTKPDALVRWIGDRAILDPRPNGEFTLFFDDRCVEGRYLEVDPPRRLVIAWGRRGSPSFPPLTSTLEVILASENGGTRVHIIHHGLPDIEAALHALGWKHYLARLQILGSGREPEVNVTPAILMAGPN